MTDVDEAAEYDAEVRVMGDLQNQVTRGHVNFKKIPKDRITEAYVSTRLEGLKTILNGRYAKTCGRMMTPRTRCDYYNCKEIIANYFRVLYSIIENNYLAVCTLLVMLVLSFLIPDLTKKVNVTKEIKDIQKVLDMMSKEVTRAEAACLTAANDVCCLHCSVRDDSTETSREVKDNCICTNGSLFTTRSEPVHSAKEDGLVRRIFFANRNISNKEIAIKSYVYTNSFDAKKSPTCAATMTLDSQDDEQQAPTPMPVDDE